MRIGVDLDGVVYDFTGSLREWLVHARRYPAEQVAPEPTCWEFFWHDWAIPFADYLAECHRAADAGHLFRYGEPLGDSLAHLDTLRAAGHSIHLVTDRGFGKPGDSQRNTVRWLADHNVPFDSITFSRDKTSVPTDMFIDDKPANIDALLAVGCDAWLLDCGRKDQVGHPRLIPNWSTFLDKVKTLDGGFPVPASGLDVLKAAADGAFNPEDN